MACATTSRSAGSSCWSARARGEAHTAAAASASAGREARISSPHARTQEGERFVRGELGAGAVAAMAVLELARLEAALAHHQAMRDAEQLGVREFDAGARVAIIEQHFDAGGGELGVQAVGGGADTV